MPHPLTQRSHPENVCNEICSKSWTSGRRSKRLRGAPGQAPYNALWAELKGKGFLCPNHLTGQEGQEVSVRGKAWLLHPLRGNGGTTMLEKKEKHTHSARETLTKICVDFMARVQLGHADKIRHALIGRRGSPSLQIHILLRSEDGSSTCDIIVCMCLDLNPDDIGTRGFHE